LIALRSLERFARNVRRAREDAGRCELCASPIEERHRHVVDLAERRLLCTCAGCALLFASTASVMGRYRAVPMRVRCDPGWTFAESDLQALGVPVGLAFFFRPSSSGQWTAVFPSPAGPTEAEISDEAWSRMATDNDLLLGIEDDVEALLVLRRREARSVALVVPIDACYELTAILKTHWRGIDGGDAVRTAIDEFFDQLVARAEPIRTRPGATPPTRGESGT
jgi:hypothetical protein